MVDAMILQGQNYLGGLVRRKNVLSVLAQCLEITGLVTILWWLYWSLSKSKQLPLRCCWQLLGTTIIAFALKAVMGLRPSEETEVNGLDVSEHGEEGYHSAAYSSGRPNFGAAEAMGEGVPAEAAVRRAVTT